jgi:exopolyphosphatase / guanosine-5'-triphosphate,3'-diphosphate pyrophosphatase
VVDGRPVRGPVSGPAGAGPAAPVAAIDCGTNSLRLLVRDPDGHDVVRRMEIVRLGYGVDATGRLDDAALARTFTALEDYAEVITRTGATHIRMVATSATRDAANRQVFVDGVRRILGIEPDVISGTEEAALSFAGATGALAACGARPPFMVWDIGGGSTEIVVGDQRPRWAVSVDIGCVRITERHLRSDPPTPDQVAEARADIRSRLAAALGGVDVSDVSTVIGVAGTVTTIAAIDLGLTNYDPDAIDGARLEGSAINRIAHQLLASDAAARRAIPVMHPGRADVIGGGVLVLEQLLAVTGTQSLLVSERDILDGIADSVSGG